MKLSTSQWIRHIQKHGAQKTGRFVILRYAPAEIGSAQMAIIVSSKVGRSVVRNKVKRRILEILRKEIQHHLMPGYFLVIAKKSIIHAEFKQLLGEILELTKGISGN